MTATSLDELLVVALKDLREGRVAVMERLPELASATRDAKVRTIFGNLVTRSAEEAVSLAGMLKEPRGERNLWATGILDDACRDVASTAAGPVRDVALIGAIRKFLAADAVSMETAIALSQNGGEERVPALEAMRRAGLAASTALGGQLPRLTAQ
ncbi:hypothetical protein [Pseudopontixanthobacter vadosimaris]|uniref:hypothetical protein n=1 Tax=Pseudopontixanthobacter vadosimaris TaxID=2726450 RepID=UPI001473CF08|nr:hypothetical protein [Pseudopontixanthobacter vadosimaris]